MKQGNKPVHGLSFPFLEFQEKEIETASPIVVSAFVITAYLSYSDSVMPMIGIFKEPTGWNRSSCDSTG